MPRKKAEPKPKAPPKPKKAASTAAVPVSAHKFSESTRPNIPTRENAALVADDEKAPKVLLYPRDPSLDPQLVWKGKDAQDREDLSVLAVPIYIQEKIHPEFLIEDLKKRTQANRPPVADLFADFNGLDSDAKRFDYYKHGQHWTNRLILGDSLMVMASLAEKERLRGQVQCIYFDPPYGIKFNSNWQVSTRKRDVKDAKIEDLSREPEVVKAFRDTWELGIHSYLAYLRDRLIVARDLLTDSGSIFVQIGDENVHLVRCLMDEVFGSENFVSQITFFKSGSQTSDLLPNMGDYILWYAKDTKLVKRRPVWSNKLDGKSAADVYRFVLLPDGTRRGLADAEFNDDSLLPKGSKVYRLAGMTSASGSSTTTYDFELAGKRYVINRGGWRVTKAGMDRLVWADRIVGSGSTIATYKYIDDFPLSPQGNIWMDTGTGSFTDTKIYVVQTGSKVVQRCLAMTTDPGDLVLDPTCGSGTTAYVAEQWGRRWITVDTSRVALSLARTRLMAAKFPYYLLADSAAGRKWKRELVPLTPIPSPAEGVGGQIPTLTRGFVYKTVPHVTLKSIANNPDIREGMSREQIDAAIRKHAETETLFDQPYEDKGTVRVSGPFTVESLSPHRMLPSAEFGVESAELKTSENSEIRIPQSEFPQIILENLRKAGVQNTKKKERIQFDPLDYYPGRALCFAGEYTDAEGKKKRVGVCLGPEFGTVGQELIHEAAKEAARSIKFDFDLVLVCGFAFDPHVWEDGQDVERQHGKMKVLLVRMNPDLSMGDELLKKTGAGNLFMVFGEPDVTLNKLKDGKYSVTVNGVDVFDPNTGQIRNSDTKDIACWFLDTAYDEKSFFVRHAYFLGANEPFEKLQKALRAEIDEGEWSKLYSATSVPFAAPPGGKIAVKVVNHYGDEVLKVYSVG